MAEQDPPLHVVIVNYVYECNLASARQAIERYFTITGWSQGLLAAGARVTVLARFSQDARLDHGGAAYHFVADSHPPWLRSWQISRPVHRLASACCAESLARGEPTVVHVNGLLFPAATRMLAGSLASHTRPVPSAVVVQHHAERPGRGLAGRLQRWGLRPVDGFFFAARELAQEWIEQGSILSLNTVHEVMEASSPFCYEDRSRARARTAMAGDPVVLWTGNLNANKDPLTILAGFERILDRLPGARLYMAYRYADLLPEVRARIQASEKLRSAVTLLGEIPHAEIASYYNSADFFVQGSAREGSGLALLDAMACGAVPVVTGIPSFRTITGDGHAGVLWRVGDVDGFVRAFLDVAERPLAPQSERVRRYFDAMWSPMAIGKRAVAAYRQILDGQIRGRLAKLPAAGGRI